MYIAMQGLSYLLEPQPHRPSPHSPLNISTTEKDKQPASSSSSGDRETREEREREERYASEVRKHEKWNDENKQLVGAIYFCVSVSYRMVVKECTTVLEIFTKFDEMFLKQDKMQKLMHKEQFMQFKFDEAKEINAQFMRYEELLERNIALGNEFSLRERAEYLQIALPSKYKSLLFDYHTLHPLQDLTYTFIKGLITERWERAKVIEKEERKEKEKKERDKKKGEHPKKEGNSEKALLSQPPPNQKKREKGKQKGGEEQKDKICHNCKKKGHTVFRCTDDLTPEGIAAINQFKKQIREKEGEKKKPAEAHKGKGKKEREVTCFAIPSLSSGDEGELGLDSEIFAFSTAAKMR